MNVSHNGERVDVYFEALVSKTNSVVSGGYSGKIDPNAGGR
jgi:hypothetical protein